MTWRRSDPYSSFPFHCYSHPDSGIEAACEELKLDDSTCSKVMQAHRHAVANGGDGLLKTMLDRGCDYIGVVRARIELMRKVGIQ